MVAASIAAGVFAQQQPSEAAEELNTSDSSAEELILLNDAENPDTQVPDSEDNGIAVGGVMDFVRMLLMLVLVLAMIYGVILLLKRSQRMQRPESSLISLAATQPLSGNRAVHLIQVGQQVFLVGEGEAGVRLLSEITDQESLDEIRLRAPLEQQAAGKSFAELLGGMLKTRSSGQPVEDESKESETTPSFHFIQNRRERLKDL